MWNSNSGALKLFHWDTSTLIYLHIIYSFFYASMAELKSWDRDHMAGECKIFTACSFID